MSGRYREHDGGGERKKPNDSLRRTKEREGEKREGEQWVASDFLALLQGKKR